MEAEAVSGARLRALLAKYDPVSCSWKTSRRLRSGGLAPFSENWSRSGLIVNGTAYRLRTLEPGPGGTESGYLPTPVASSGKGCKPDRYFGSPSYRGNFHEALRNGPAEPIYPHPDFVERLMGYPPGWTVPES